MANWSLPSLSDLYTNFLTYLKARDDDAVRLNDSRVTAATNAPDYAKRWNDSAKTFQNWLSAAWSNLVIGIAGGGTGATTAATARTNLDVYSKAEADAAFATSLTSATNTLASPVTLTTNQTWYNGATVSLAAGTWLVVGSLNLYAADYASPVNLYVRIKDASTTYAEAMYAPSYTTIGSYDCISLSAVVTLGATTSVSIAAYRNGGSASCSIRDNTMLNAVKIA